MEEGPKGQPSLEEQVYRSSLGEGERALRGASPWLTVPVTLAVIGALGGLGLILDRPSGTGTKVPESVSVVLQEGGDAPARAAAPAPAPAPAAAPAAAPAPAPAPVPQNQPPPPPEPRPEAAPDAVPRELPTEDHSRQYGGSAGSAGSTGGTGAGTGGTGAGTGTGLAGAGGGPGRIVDVAFSAVKAKFQPPAPEYPPLARRARVQGTVVVQILVGLDGVPISVRSLAGPFLLRGAAEAYAMAWRFYPHLENGVPQVARFALTVNFNMT